MKFNISYFGPSELAHFRRDIILPIYYGLIDLGHQVELDINALASDQINILISSYFLTNAQLKQLKESGVQYGNFCTEIVTEDTLNHSPDKTDFLGGYLPFIKSGLFAWDGHISNIERWQSYGVEAELIRFGYHNRIEEIEHSDQKDLDFYFFGLLSDYRRDLIDQFKGAGLIGRVHGECPPFVRNSWIGRTKVCLNLVQDEKYSHVNGNRITYLANNRCAVLSQNNRDENEYYQYSAVCEKDQMVDTVREMVDKNSYVDIAEESYEKFKKRPIQPLLEDLLERTFSKGQI